MRRGMLIVGVMLSGCGAHHERVFAKQAKQPALEEPFLALAPPVPSQRSLLAEGRLTGADKRHASTGEALLYETEDAWWVHITDWQTREGLDLYFYLSERTVPDVKLNPGMLPENRATVKLTANNLRPDTLQFAGEELWFQVPKDTVGMPQSVHIYSEQRGTLFASAPLDESNSPTAFARP